METLGSLRFHEEFSYSRPNGDFSYISKLATSSNMQQKETQDWKEKLVYLILRDFRLARLKFTFPNPAISTIKALGQQCFSETTDNCLAGRNKHGRNGFKKLRKHSQSKKKYKKKERKERKRRK